MSKHRDVAKVVYASSLGRESAARIWRTVVVAGAMLASPMIASAEEAKPAPPPTASKPAPPPTASKPAPPPPTKAELAKQAAEVVKALAAEMVELDKKITATTTELKDAKDQSSSDAAKAKLTDQRKAKTELKAKHTAARAEQRKADAAARAEANANKPKPRPRGDNEMRPKGRGFILS